MKIVSEIAKDNYLLKVSKKELANILGNSSPGDLNYRFLEDAIATEKNLEVSKIYQHYDLLKSKLKENDYSKAKRKLEEMIEALTPIDSLLNEVIIEFDKTNAINK